MMSKRISDAVSWMALVAFCVFTVIDKSITNSSMISLMLFLMPACLMLLVYVISRVGTLHFHNSVVWPYLAMFVFFCYASSVWGIEPKFAINKGNTLVTVLFAICLFDLCLPYKQRVNFILQAIMWSGFIVVLFTIVRYGWSSIKEVLSDNTRIDNTVINANTLGMNAAFSILICLYYTFVDRFCIRNILALAFSALSMIVLAASGSRKAIFTVALGVSFFLLFTNIDKKKILTTMTKTAVVICALAVLFIVLSRMEMFQGTIGRIQTMIEGLIKSGSGDKSTSIRLRLIQIGNDLFRSHPILGVGMDNAQLFTKREFGIENYYLHNNYVEMLADGGLVGFLTYYWIYIYLIIRYLKKRDFKNYEFSACFTLLLIRLIMEYGMVTYEIEGNYVFILAFVGLVNNMRTQGIKTLYQV